MIIIKIKQLWTNLMSGVQYKVLPWKVLLFPILYILLRYYSYIKFKFKLNQ